MFAGAVAAIIVVGHAAFTGGPACSAQQPCTPDPVGTLVAGGLFTLPVLGFVQLRFAAIVAFAVELAASQLIALPFAIWLGR